MPLFSSTLGSVEHSWLFWWEQAYPFQVQSSKAISKMPWLTLLLSESLQAPPLVLFYAYSLV
jgi:hypothetical protein